MCHISPNNIDRKLIIVSLSLFSASWNPNIVVIMVCGAMAAIFKLADMNLQCPISRRILYIGS